jgi:hypothetical protein
MEGSKTLEIKKKGRRQKIDLRNKNRYYKKPPPSNLFFGSTNIMIVHSFFLPF